MKNILLAMAALALSACATVPDPPECSGSYRSLNPTHYTLQDTGHGTVQTTINAG